MSDPHFLGEYFICMAVSYALIQLRKKIVISLWSFEASESILTHQRSSVTSRKTEILESTDVKASKITRTVALVRRLKQGCSLGYIQKDVKETG